jgi:ribosomal protein L11 methyltransferase
MLKAPAEGVGWIEISFDIQPNVHEALSAFLFDMGCEGVVSEDFGEKTLRGYLPPGQNIEAAKTRIYLFLHRLKEIFPEIQIPEPVLRKLEEENWNLKWRQFFRPEHVTPNLLILPAWEPLPEGVEGHVLLIDPGPAFGTGQHPTTRMCLRAMEEISLNPPWTMLDVGTGSGILAIYGAMLGAAGITAVDIDPEALRWASRNIELNHRSEVIEVSKQPIEKITGRFSLLAANLTLNPILDLFPHFSRILDPGGCLILSGLLRDQVEKVKEPLAKNGLNSCKEFFSEEWACLVARSSPAFP